MQLIHLRCACLLGFRTNLSRRINDSAIGQILPHASTDEIDPLWPLGLLGSGRPVQTKLGTGDIRVNLRSHLGMDLILSALTRTLHYRNPVNRIDINGINGINEHLLYR